MPQAGPAGSKMKWSVASIFVEAKPSGLTVATALDRSLQEITPSKKDDYSIQRAKQRQDAEIALRIEYHLQFNWTDECVFQAIVDGVSG